MKSRTCLPIVLAITLFSTTAFSQTSPWDMVEKMGKGINLGNTLEAPHEGDWSTPADSFYFHDFVDAGFTCVRIPIRWTNHMLDVAPYTVDSAWMARVEQVIDWALDTGLVVIINSHHDNEWLYDEFPKNLDRFGLLWEQIALAFKDKSDDLLFEIINEPYFDLSRDEVDTLQNSVFPIIRESNPTRIVLFTGGGNDTTPRMTNYRVFYHMNLPDDPYVMAYFHYYVPYQYCQLGNGTWGTVQEQQQMIHDFTVAKDWAETNDVPILLGEFAVTRQAHRPSLVKWYEHLTKNADEFGFAQTTWCTGNEDGMSTYFRAYNYWDQELVNIQTRQFPWPDTMPSAPGVLQAEDFDRGGQQVAYRSMDSINSLGFYRPDEGMEIDSLGDSNYAVVFQQKGEWLEYSVFIDSASLYEIAIDASSLSEGNTIEARFNSSMKTESMPVPLVADKNEFSTLRDTVYLGAGVQVIRILGEGTGVWVDQLVINKVSVPEDTTNLLTNPDFELGLIGWTAKSCAIETVEDPVQSGSAAVFVTERAANWASVQQDITETLREKGPGYYTSSAFIRSTVDTLVSGKVTVRITVAGENSYIGASSPMPPSEWAYLESNMLISWDGNLEEAFFYVETLKPYDGDFYCDNASLRLDSALAPPVSIQEATGRDGFELSQNYPNPFDQNTSILFSIVRPGDYKLVIYDLNGKVLMCPLDSKLQAGKYSLNVDASTLGSGTYIYRLSGPGGILTRKMILTK